MNFELQGVQGRLGGYRDHERYPSVRHAVHRELLMGRLTASQHDSLLEIVSWSRSLQEAWDAFNMYQYGKAKAEATVNPW